MMQAPGAVVPPVPIQEAVTDFVIALLSLGASASKVTPTKLGATGEHVIGTYRDDEGATAALIVADLAFAAATGAALAMIPATAAKEALKLGNLTETLMENFREVANITATLLNTPTTPHVALVDVWTSDHPDLPDAVWSVLVAPNKRREFAVTIDGYGSGRLGLVIA